MRDAIRAGTAAVVLLPVAIVAGIVAGLYWWRDAVDNVYRRRPWLV